MFSQVRSGAIDIFTIGSPIVNAVPIAAISSIAFAFPTFDQVWAAVDGDLGAHVRRAIGTGINLIALEKMWDNGYRQITTSSKPITRPDDLKGMKLRVPVSPLFTSMFKALGTSPTAINFVEVYSALQTSWWTGRRIRSAADRHGEVLRGPEVLLTDQPHVGRLLDGGEPAARSRSCRMTCARPRSACSTRRRQAARRHGQAQCEPGERAQGPRV
jgi:hypothetical protein